MTVFQLPPVITDLVLARNRLRDHYHSAALEFTLDGNLIGDIGEAAAAELFGLTLLPRNGTGIDGHAPDGRSVQVKATGTNRGPAFRMVDTRADHLLFLVFDLENLKGEVVYNGPEEPVIKLLPTAWVGQKMVSMAQIRRADAAVCDSLRQPATAVCPLAPLTAGRTLSALEDNDRIAICVCGSLTTFSYSRNRS